MEIVQGASLTTVTTLAFHQFDRMKTITFNQTMYRSLLRRSSLPAQKTSVVAWRETLPSFVQICSTPNRSQLSKSSSRKYATDVSLSSTNAKDRARAIAESRAALDDVLRSREREQRRAHSIWRAKISAAGMLISMAIPLLIVMNLNIDDMAKKDTDEGGNLATGNAPSHKQSEQQPKASVPLLTREKADSNVGNGSDFDGKPVIMQRGMSKPVAHNVVTGEDTELVSTGNSTVPFFPRTITLPTSSASTPNSTNLSTLPSAIAANSSETAKSEPYVLLGLGIRTVSFLSIQVYVVGLYVPQSDLPNLQQSLTSYINPLASALIPNEKATLKQSLLDPSASQEIWSAVLHGSTPINSSSSSSIPASTATPSHTKPLRAALRIVPVRNTDFAHLRDGWVRGITSRTQTAARTGSHEFDDERFGTAMRDFKALFGGKGRAPKGSVMILARDADGKLEILMKEEREKDQQKDQVGRNVGAELKNATATGSSVSVDASSSTAAERYASLGTVADERISRLIVMGYLAGKDVSSEGARRDIVDGVMGLVERPAGTIEAKVE